MQSPPSLQAGDTRDKRASSQLINNTRYPPLPCHGAIDTIQRMDEGRLDRAVNRMGTAMDRLEAAIASRPPPPVATSQSSPQELELISQHEKMQSEVRDTLAALDDLISGLEK